MLPDNLEPVDVRVIGSLIEKELSTPDNYPLSLNALTAACNQSSNRDPVMSLEERTVSQGIDRLRRLGLVRSIQAIGSRVPKYSHLLAEVGALTRAELAVLSVLMLRGSQTQAEVRTRAARLLPGDDSNELDGALDALMTRETPPVVVRLARRPGQKEPRYAHHLSGDVTESAHEPASIPPVPGRAAGDRVTALEDAVQALHDEVAHLRSQLASLESKGGSTGNEA
jgi:uncharacterized protein YceH (UPF0502 family)